MLVLSRRIGERILLSDGVEIMLTNVRGGTAWIGIEAPTKIRILREEVVHAAIRDRGDAGRTDDRGARPAD